MTVAQYPLTGGHRLDRRRIQGVRNGTVLAGRQAAENAFWGQSAVTSADTAAATDTVARLLAEQRATSDTSTATDVSTRGALATARAVSDNALVETGTPAAHLLSALRNMSDSCASLDTGRPTRNFTAFGVNTTQAGGIGYPLTGGRRLTRQRIQTVAAANDAFWGHAIQTPDSAFLADSALGTLGHSLQAFRTTADQSTATDIGSHVLSAQRTAVNALTISSGLFTAIPGSAVQGGAKLWLGSPGLSSTSTAPDAATASDTATQTHGFGRTGADNSVDTDSVARVFTAKPRTATETSADTDSLTRGALQSARAPSDSAVDTDAATRSTLALTRTAADASADVDSVKTPHGASTQANDTSTDTDSVARTESTGRAGADTSSDVDAASRSIISFARTGSDTASSSDVATRVLNAIVRMLADGSLTADSATAAAVITRAAADTSADTDSATHGTIFRLGTGTDNAVSTETVARLLTAARTPADTATTDATLSAQVVIVRGAADTATADEIAGPHGLVAIRVASDNAAANDGIIILVTSPPAGLLGIVQPKVLAGFVAPFETAGRV